MFYHIKLFSYTNYNEMIWSWSFLSYPNHNIQACNIRPKKATRSTTTYHNKSKFCDLFYSAVALSFVCLLIHAHFNVQFWIGHQPMLMIEIQTHLFPIDLIAHLDRKNKLWRCFLLTILLYLFFFSILISVFIQVKRTKRKEASIAWWSWSWYRMYAYFLIILLCTFDWPKLLLAYIKQHTNEMNSL